MVTNNKKNILKKRGWVGRGRGEREAGENRTRNSKKINDKKNVRLSTAGICILSSTVLNHTHTDTVVR